MPKYKLTLDSFEGAYTLGYEPILCLRETWSLFPHTRGEKNLTLVITPDPEGRWEHDERGGDCGVVDTRNGGFYPLLCGMLKILEKEELTWERFDVSLEVGHGRDDA